MERLLIFASLFCASFASPLNAELDLHPLVRRDVPLTVVSDALYNISNYTITLGYAINNFSVTDKALLNLQYQRDLVLGAIMSGAEASKNIDNLTTADVIGLTSILAQLTTTVNNSVADTIKQKKNFGGLGPVILSGLKNQQAATIEFQEAVLDKIPANLVALAADANKPILSSLATGISVFSTPNVNDDKSVYTSDAMGGVAVKHVAIMISVVLGGMLVGTGRVW